MSDYNIEPVSFYDCIEFIFHSEQSIFLLAVFLVVLLLRLLYSFEIIGIKQAGNGKKILNLNLDMQNLSLNRKWEWAWMASGLAAVFGTIAASEVVSAFVYPIIVLRYLYPSFIIIWLLFSVNISRSRIGGIWTALLVAFIFIGCYPTYISTLKAEQWNNKRLEATLAATEPKINEEDFIYTDIVHFDWTVSEVYYPKTPHALFGQPEWWGTAELPGLRLDTEYWLFLSTPISEEVVTHLGNMGYEPGLIVENGYIGAGNVWVYQVTPK